MNKVASLFDGLSCWEVLTWVRPHASGLALGVCLVTWYFLVAQSNNVITLLCRLVMLGMSVGGASRAGLFSLTPESVNQVSNIMERAVRSFAHSIYPVLTWKCPKLSGAVLVASVIISFVTASVSFSVSILLIIALVFGAPIGYQKNKETIKKHLSKVSAAACNAKRGAGESLHRAVDAADDFTKKID